MKQEPLYGKVVYIGYKNGKKYGFITAQGRKDFFIPHKELKKLQPNILNRVCKYKLKTKKDQIYAYDLILI